MKLTPKFLVLAFILALTSAVLAACGDSTRASENPIPFEEAMNVNIFHPDTGFEERDRTDLLDDTGARIYGKIGTALSAGDSGWVTYRRSRPGEQDSERDPYKLSYVHRADNNLYVGAGIWLDENNPYASDGGRIHQMRMLVDRAAEVVEADPTSGKSQACGEFFGTNRDMWVTDGGEAYLFIGTIEQGSSTMICHPRPSTLGSNIYVYEDELGRVIGKDALQELQNTDTSWLVVQFPKLGEPDTAQDPAKLVYFRRVGNVFVGSGIYLDENNPNSSPNDRAERVRTLVNDAVKDIQSKGKEAALEAFAQPGSPYTTGEGGQNYLWAWENR